MTPTEARACAWLERQGYAADAMTFRGHVSPDFLTTDGRGWEVKLISGQHVAFTLTQVAAMRAHGRTAVLLFQEQESEPWAVVPLDVLPLTGVWRGIHLTVTDSRPHHPYQPIPSAVELERRIAGVATDGARRHIGLGAGVCSCGWVGEIATRSLRQLRFPEADVLPEQPEAVAA